MMVFRMSADLARQVTESNRYNSFYIYFIGGAGLLKIGSCTGKPFDRMKHFQTGSPVELTLEGFVHVFIGDHKRQKVEKLARKVEKKFHLMFDNKRVRGEWFDDGDSILEEVASDWFVRELLAHTELNKLEIVGYDIWTKHE